MKYENVLLSDSKQIKNQYLLSCSKNGYINITKNNYKQLILTTCSPEHKDKQLIINAKIKKS